MQLDGQKSQRSRKEGKSRKKGKKKHRKGKESESEEDVEQLHAVSTVLDAPDVRGFICLLIEGLYIAQSTAQGHLRAFHKFKSRTS